MDLSLRQLQAIVAIAEERSLTGAGRRLRLSQQSISALLRNVEARLGVRLFYRTTRSVEPTPACEALVSEIRHSLNRIGSALEQVRQTGRAEPPLILAITPSIAYGELNVLLEALEEHGLPHPDVREVWSDELLAGIREGRFDAGVSVEVPVLPSFDVRPWRRHRVDLLVAECHPFASEGEATVSRLEDTTLVMPGERTNPGLRDRLLETLSRAGVRPNMVDVPRVAGPAPVLVERGQAATIWLSSMENRFRPGGLVRVRLHSPETFVVTSLITTREPRAPIVQSIAALQDVIEQTSAL